MAQCASTALAGAVPCPCVRGARGRFGGFGPVPGVVSLPFPPSCPAFPALRVAGRPVRVSLILARWYAIPRGLCVPRARSGCPSGSPRVPFACVCARAPAASAPLPLGGVACAPHAVPALGAGRAVPRGPCPSACPAPVPCSVWRAWGGGVRPRFPPTWLGVVGVAEGRPRGGCLPLLRGASGVRRSPSPDCPPTGRAVGVCYPRAVGAGVWVRGPYTVPLACTPCGGCVPRGWWGAVPLPGLGLCAPRGAGPWRSCAGGRARGGGGGSCAVPPVCAAGGGPVVRGVALPCSVPLPSLGRQQSGSHWPRSVHGGRGPPYHSGSCSPAFTGHDLCGVLARWRGLACSPRFLWEPAAGAGGRAALQLLSRAGGGGTIAPASGGAGRGPRGLRAGWGGGGGGSRRGLPAPPLGGGPRFPTLAPLLSSAHSPPACVCGQGRGAAPGWGGMRGGPWTAPLGAPADLNPPSALPEWAVVMGGSWGARPPYCSGAPPCAAPRLGPRAAPARWCGLACRPRPPREQAAGGAGARCVQVQPHPPTPASRSLLGEGRRPLGSGRGEGRSCGPQAGGGERGGGVGGPPPHPPRPVGRRPAIRCLRRAPLGYTRAVGVAGRPRASGAVRSAANGSVRRGGGGGGGGNPPALVCAPVFSGPASEGVAPFAPSWAPPVRRRPAADRACGRLPRPWCSLTPGAAASSGGVRGRRFLGLPPSALGPEGEGGGGVGGGLSSRGAAP